MSDKVLELVTHLQQDDPATFITNLWTTYNNGRQKKMQDWLEVSNYVHATGTTHTNAMTLPWANTTTKPKLTQINDNLIANYSSALFPNDKWLKWEGHNKESSTKTKRDVITGYMENKTRMGNFRQTINKLITDYVQKGNAFCQPTYEERYNETPDSLNAGFIGPKVERIAPEDIIFNPLANSIGETFKVVRSVKTLGELVKLSRDQPEQAFWDKAIQNRMDKRVMMSGYSYEDWNKAERYSIDGFGNLWDYYQSEYVEILEFYGDYHDRNTNDLHTDRMITIVDRSLLVRDEQINTYDGKAAIFHVGWRDRPDNLWAMGPLDNLVGLQYRLDHQENAKEDAIDLAIAPPLMILGDVDPFVWGPREEIHITSGEGDVREVAKNLNAVIAITSDMAGIESSMELYAGAPREAAGIRSPGEKTAFEVQSLQNAAGRIFQEKITKFEIELLEPLINSMLELAFRNLNETDLIRVIDNDLGVAQFKTITKEDITAKGILRPVGARHFAQKAQELQNLVGVFSSPLGALIQPHTSPKAIAEYITDAMDIRGYEIFRDNVGVEEQAETQGLINQSQSDLETQAGTPTEGEIAPDEA